MTPGWHRRCASWLCRSSRWAAAVVLIGIGFVLPREGHAQAGSGEVRVWVNTSSGVYHCPNTRYYGATKRGEFVTESEARAKGDRPAYGRGCGGTSAAQSLTLRSGSPGDTVRVWVNTASGVYHCPGSTYYQATKRGRLMPQREARSEGYRPAYGRAC
jgi:hypothetical protein